MTKARLSKLAAICAVLVLTFIPNFVTKADGPVDLKAEAQTVATYLDDVGKVARNISELNKRGTLVREDFDKSKTDVDGLKRRLGDVERAVSAIIKKLKDSNAWENFDEQLLQTLTDPKAKQVLQKCGGPKKCLEDASRLTADAGELDHLLEHLRTKLQARAGDDVLDDGQSFVGAQIMPAVYRPGGDSLACRASRVVMEATNTTKSINRAYCLCVEMTVLDESLAQCMAGFN